MFLLVGKRTNTFEIQYPHSTTAVIIVVAKYLKPALLSSVLSLCWDPNFRLAFLLQLFDNLKIPDEALVKTPVSVILNVIQLVSLALLVLRHPIISHQNVEEQHQNHYHAYERRETDTHYSISLISPEKDEKKRADKLQRKIEKQKQH